MNTPDYRPGARPGLLALPLLALLLPAALPLPAGAQAAAKPPTELQACAAANRAAWTEAAGAQDASVRRHAMHPVLVTRLQGLAPQLARLRETTQRAPRQLADCEQAAQALAALREQQERIVGSSAQVAECVAANQRAQAELQAALLGLQQAGVAPAMLQTAAGRLDSLRAAPVQVDPTLADCRQQGSEIALELAGLKRLAPPVAAAAPAAGPAPAAAGATAATAAARVGAAVGAGTGAGAGTGTGTGTVASAGASSPAATAAACRQTQARAYNEVAQSYGRVAGAGSALPPEWLTPLHALSERLTRLHATISNTAVPDWDCAAVARALAQARDELAPMLRR